MNDLNPNPIRTKWFHMFIYNYSYAHLRIFTYTWLFSLTLCPSVHCLFSVYRTVAAEVRKQIAGQYGGSPQLFKNLNVGTTASNTVSSMFTLGDRIRPICLRLKQVGCCQSVCWKMLNFAFNTFKVALFWFPSILFVQFSPSPRKFSAGGVLLRIIREASVPLFFTLTLLFNKTLLSTA